MSLKRRVEWLEQWAAATIDRELMDDATLRTMASAMAYEDEKQFIELYREMVGPYMPNIEQLTEFGEALMRLRKQRDAVSSGEC